MYLCNDRPCDEPDTGEIRPNCIHHGIYDFRIGDLEEGIFGNGGFAGFEEKMNNVYCHNSYITLPLVPSTRFCSLHCFLHPNNKDDFRFAHIVFHMRSPKKNIPFHSNQAAED